MKGYCLEKVVLWEKKKTTYTCKSWWTDWRKCLLKHRSSKALCRDIVFEGLWLRQHLPVVCRSTNRHHSLSIAIPLHRTMNIHGALGSIELQMHASWVMTTTKKSHDQMMSNSLPLLFQNVLLWIVTALCVQWLISLTTMISTTELLTWREALLTGRCTTKGYLSMMLKRSEEIMILTHYGKSLLKNNFHRGEYATPWWITLGFYC